MIIGVQSETSSYWPGNPETPNSHCKTPSFSLKYHQISSFIPLFSVKTPRKPQLSIRDIRNFIGALHWRPSISKKEQSPVKTWGSPKEKLGSFEDNFGIFHEYLGFSNKNLSKSGGLRCKAWGLSWKFGGPRWDVPIVL